MPTTEPPTDRDGNAADSENAVAQMPSEATRATITLIVFIHLFIVIAGSFSGTRVSSQLLIRLYNAPGFAEYLGFLHMGSYSHHLTLNGDMDQDHNCEVVLEWQDGLATDSDEFRELQKLNLYDEQGMYPLLRRGRYQELAKFAASRVGGESADESRLPLAITKRLVHENQITEGRHRFRLRRQMSRPPEFDPDAEPSPEDPYDASHYRNVYQADVTFFRGKANINKVSQSRETAPVDRPRDQNRSSSNRSSGQSAQPPTNSDPLPNGNRN